MRLLLIILVLASHTVSSQDLKLFYPELDAILITIWQLSDEGISTSKLKVGLNSEWNNVKPILVNNIDQAKNPRLIPYFEKLIDNISSNITANKLRYARSNSWELLRQFRKLRRANTSYEYPLDVLFETYESFQEVDYAIHDQMFGLYYWFEFTDLTNDMKSHWFKYKEIDTVELMFYYPTIDLAVHQAQKQKFAQCLYDFFDSLDSGYQPDFQMPCDEMGYALIELIGQYRKTYNDEEFIDKL